MLLVVLKYIGLCLAAASSVWGTIHNLTTDSPDGRRRLTRPGFISIGITIIGLVIGVVSEDLQRRQAANDQANKIAAEARRTNQIIIAAQPLAALSLSLRLDSNDELLKKQYRGAEHLIRENAETSQGGVPIVPFDTMEYESKIIPFLQYLAGLSQDTNSRAQTSADNRGDSTEIETVFAILPLDDSRNTVLSFGRLKEGVKWYGSSPKSRLSTGFSPISRNARPGHSVPHLNAELKDQGNSTYRLTWDLDPVTLENAVDRRVDKILATGKLPPKLEFVVISGDALLPFGKNNFADSSAENLWQQKMISAAPEKVQTDLPSMALQIEVNGFSELTYTYRLVGVERRTLYNSWEDEFKVACAVLQFVREDEK